MKRSTSSPGDAVPTGESRALVAVLSRGKNDTPAQRLFKKLIGKIERAREQLKTWETYAHHYMQRLAGEVQPLEAKLHEKQREMALLIGEILPQQGGDPKTRLRRSDRSTLRSLLHELLSSMPDDGTDKELTALRAQYAPPRAKRGQSGIEELIEQAGKIFEEAERDSGTRGHGDGSRKKGGTAGHRPEAPGPALRAVSPSLRDAYRKLVSILHPDRESDPEERERKNELMQRVNQAYETQDLLTLLSLQVELENLDVKQLSSSTRVTQYNEVLREQLSRLEAQLSAMRLTFAPLMGPNVRTPSVKAVDKQLTVEIGRLKAVLQDLVDDLVRFRDPVQLRAFLDRATWEQQQEEFLKDMLGEVEALLEMGIDVFAEDPEPRRPRRTRKRKGAVKRGKSASRKAPGARKRPR